MSNKYVEVKIFEPAEDGLFSHPDRYRYSIFWTHPDGGVTEVGTEAKYYPDKNGRFEMRLGSKSAQIVGEVGEDQRKRSDRFEYC